MDNKEHSITTALKKKAADIVRNVESLTERTRDWQMVKQYLSNRLGDLKLTEKQQVKMQRYQFIYNQSISGKYTETDILNAVMKMYGIEQTQAYDDLAASKEVFSSVVNINKKFELNVQLQVNRNLMRKAEEICDLKAAAAFEKNRIALLALIEDQEENPGELFEGHQFENVFDPAIIGAASVDLKELMTVINEKRKVKIKPELFQHLEFIDIPHEQADPL
ncbi:MAG: hypothetical protein H7320_11630 [Ferruginibacter sp.]|nr:hypothetical protein [Ferruginibacter sp.]